MRRSQGRPFSPEEIDRIKFLLSSTELTLEEIAIRMECAKSSVVAINQNFQIRQYRGRRRSWVCSMAKDAAETAGPQVQTMSDLNN
jgi:hypothetical protein